MALAIEAVILGGPATALGVYGIPWLLAIALAGIVEHPLNGVLGLVCPLGSVLALIEFWRLALATVQKRAYSFGLRYWLAVVGAISSFASLWGTGPSWFLIALFVPIASGAAHFSVLQLRGGYAQLGAQADSPASGGTAA